MEYILIEINSEEWEKMWKWLESHPLNEGISEPSIALNRGELWEYIGSYKNRDAIIHEFRHRCNTYDNGLKYLRLHGTKDIDKKNIRKVFKI